MIIFLNIEYTCYIFVLCLLLVVFLVVLANEVAEPAGRVAELPAAVEAVRHGVLQLPRAQQLKLLPAVEREGVDILWIRLAFGVFCCHTFGH